MSAAGFSLCKKDAPAMLSTRVMNLLVYAALSVLSILVIRALSGLPVTIPGDVGTHFFPTMLAYAILGLCAIGAVRTVLAGRGDDFRTENIGRIVATAVFMAAFFLSWENFGAFYLQAFVFLFVLFTYYRLSMGLTVRALALNAVVAFGITATCYIVFNYLIYVDL